MGWENETSSGSCPMMCFNISDTEISESATTRIRLTNFTTSCYANLAVWYSICCTYLEHWSCVYSYLLSPSYCKRYRLVFRSQGRGFLFSSFTVGPNTIQCSCILLKHDMFHNKDSQINIHFDSTAPYNKHQEKKLNLKGHKLHDIK